MKHGHPREWNDEDDDTPSRWQHTDQDEMVWDWIKTDWPWLLFVAILGTVLVAIGIAAGAFS
jgi:hypothetical protein